MTDWKYFRKIAERPSTRFLRLPAWVRGYASEMVRHASRPDGRLTTTDNPEDIGLVLYAHPEELPQVVEAVAKLVEHGFLEATPRGFFVANFKEAQESGDARRIREARSAKRSGCSNSSNSSNIVNKTEPSQRLDQIRSRSNPPIPPHAIDEPVSARHQPDPSPPLDPSPPPEPDSPPKPIGGGGEHAIEVPPSKPDPESACLRAKRYIRDPGARTYLGEPMDWPEVQVVFAEFAKSFPDAVATPRAFRVDTRVQRIVERLAEGTRPNALRLAVRMAGASARNGELEEKFQRLDAILATPGQVDRWLSQAPAKIREQVTRPPSPKASPLRSPAERVSRPGGTLTPFEFQNLITSQMRRSNPASWTGAAAHG